MADDATAAESNPAGLVILSRPELSAHMRVATYDNETPNDVSGGGSQSFSDSVWSPVYFSFVLPFRHVAFSVYYHEMSRTRAHSVFHGLSREPALLNQPTISTSDADLLLNRVGFATAVRFGRWLSLGGTARISRGRRFSEERISLPQQSIEADLVIRDRAYDFNMVGGVLFNPGGKLSVGFVYKAGDDFELEAARDFRVAGVGNVQRRSVVRHLPAVYGGGVAYRPSGRLSLMADVLRAEYSTLNAPLPTSSFLRYEPIRDATEVHAGVEYTFFIRSTPFSIRAGGFTDPDHEIYADIDSDDVHGTFGFGLVVEQKFHIDTAISLSKGTKEVQISTVYRF